MTSRGYCITQKKWQRPHPWAFVAVQTYVQRSDILLLDVESYEESVKRGFELWFWLGTAKKVEKFKSFRNSQPKLAISHPRKSQFLHPIPGKPKSSHSPFVMIFKSCLISVIQTILWSFRSSNWAQKTLVANYFAKYSTHSFGSNCLLPVGIVHYLRISIPTRSPSSTDRKDLNECCTAFRTQKFT